MKKLPTLSYDIGTLPKGLDMKDVISFYEESGVLIYDSSFGKKPEILFEDEDVLEITIKDVTFGIPEGSDTDINTERSNEILHEEAASLRPKTGTRIYIGTGGYASTSRLSQENIPRNYIRIPEIYPAPKNTQT